ncbi:activator-dependent family glycosyltransferase [Streptomyces sp. NPDC002994]|uniref:activator-dependent family glycosyltransferase n=1 Tax=Streptomyces sp. NPDC002994 TaxID=3154441 RepID=UPI0033B6942E
MRILLTSFAHNTHYYNLVPLGWALRAAGHDVRVASQPSLTATITGSGLSAVPVGDDGAIIELITEIGDDLVLYQQGMDFVDTRHEPLSWEHALGQQTIMSAMCFSPLNGDSTIDDMVALARSWKPDLVLWEPFTYAGPVAAHACGAAHARLLWGPDVVLNARQQFTALLAERPAEQREDPVGEWLTWTLERHGLDADEDTVEELFAGQWTVDPSAASLRLPVAGEVVPVRFVPYNGASVVPGWLSEPLTRPRVCITLGVSTRETYGTDDVPFHELLAGLADVDAEIVATLDTAQLPDAAGLPDNVRVVDFVPLDVLLPSCAAIVHHGGAGTCFTATVHGVPQIVVASLWDAPLKGLQLAEAGAGIALDPGELGVKTLRGAVVRALESRKMAEAARRLADEMLAAPTPAAIVPRLESLTAAHRRG